MSEDPTRREVTKTMLEAMSSAELVSRLQIEAALRINTEVFAGQGLDQLGPILQALVQNYSTQLLLAKS